MDWALALEWLVKSLVIIFALLGGFAYTTWYERRALARLQVRVGPNRAGPFGLLQPIADAVKLIFKEELTPPGAFKLVFFLAPIMTLVPSIIIAAVIPWGRTVTMFGREINLYLADVNVGIIYLMSVTSIAVYGIVLAGWASNSKYAMLGGLRSAAQMVSYELSLGLTFVAAILLGNSMSLVDIVEAQTTYWFALIQPLGALIFLTATLAEVNRAPFDMPEAEQELTAGFHTEYSGMKFALFFMAEYQKMIVVSMMAATLFFGGYREFWFLRDTLLSVDATWLISGHQFTAWFLAPLYLFIKVVGLLFLMIWVRATWPRFRYDRLMAFGWKVMLPLSLAVVFITATGILLEITTGQVMWLTVGVPAVSIFVGLIAVVFVYRSLWRKYYETV